METQSPASSRLITIGVTIAGGLGLAVFAGRAVAQGNYTMLAMIAAAFIGMVVFIGTGKNAYIMLAIATGMTGSIGVLPLPFSYQELMIAGCFGITLAHLTFKKLHLEERWISLDIILALNIAYLLTVYARNPVGFRALGTETVGARPYLIVIAAVMFYFSIIQYKLPAKLAPKFPLIIAGPVIALAFISFLAFYIPGIGKVIYPFWTGVGLDRGIIEQAGGTAEGPSRVERVPGSMLIGTTLIQLLCAYMPVANFITPMNPAMLAIFLIAIGGWLASGFRSGALVYSAYLFFNCWLRRRWQDLVPAIAVGILLICFLVVGQGPLFNLPVGMQRALSFLPGDWDYEAVSDAQGSTEWRLQIWEDVLADNEFIKNKVLGDGFGFSAYDLKIQMDAVLGIGGYMDGTKAQLITGAYHNGPLSTIRYVGIVGLLLYAILQIATLIFAVKLVKRAWNTPYRAISIFLAIPLFYGLVSFYVIFGGFDSDFPRSIFAVGLLKFVELSLRDYLTANKPAAPTEEPQPTPFLGGLPPIVGRPWQQSGRR